MKHAAISAVLVGAAALALSSSCTAQSNADPVVVPADAAIRDILADRVDVQEKNVGIVVGVVSPEGRRVVAYGRANLDDGRPLDGDTVFEIGSVTKVFTSLLLADMERRGEAHISDPVADYLPATAAPRVTGGRAMTLADLATHTSGLPFWPTGIPATSDGAVSMARYSEAQLFQFLSEFETPADVGSTWAYSNIDAGVLGLALARRADVAYEDLLQDRVTGPLEMTSTAIVPTPAMTARAAQGYDAQFAPAPAWNVPTLAGAGSLHSSVNDLLNFLDALDDEASPIDGLLPVMLETRRPGPGVTQALGWWIIGMPDDGVLTHDGGTLGFASSIAYDPNAHVGVVVLSNTANSVGDIARGLLLPTIPPAAAAQPGAATAGANAEAPPLDDYVGDYVAASGAAYTVLREGDRLLVKLPLPGLPPLPLQPEDGRSFSAVDNPTLTVMFESDESGRIVRITVRAPGRETVAERE